MKKIFYLGPKGTFSSQIAENIFPLEDDQKIPCPSFEEVVDALQSDTDYGILPIENSTSSNVHQVIDLLIRHNLSISQEAFLSINFNLITLAGNTLSNIKKIIAHPMAAAQCQQLIKEQGWELVKSKSNIDSQEMLLAFKDSSVAALTNEYLIQPELCTILRTRVADYQHNSTRFVVVSRRELNLSQDADKISLLLKIKHQPGSLAKILSKVAAQNLNLTKIESRPIPGTDWEYLFCIDLEKNDYPVNNLIKLLQDDVNYLQVIGLYPRGKNY